MDREQTIAYFSMEIGLEAGIPTYSGGLGVLAGDTIRSAADLKVPMVAVTLLHGSQSGNIPYVYRQSPLRGRPSKTLQHPSTRWREDRNAGGHGTGKT